MLSYTGIFDSISSAFVTHLDMAELSCSKLILFLAPVVKRKHSQVSRKKWRGLPNGLSLVVGPDLSL